MKKYLLEPKKQFVVRRVAVVMTMKAIGALAFLMLFFTCVLKAQELVYQNEILRELGVAGKYDYVLNLDYVILGVAATASATLATYMCWWIWSPFKRRARICVFESPKYQALQKRK